MKRNYGVLLMVCILINCLGAAAWADNQPDPNRQTVFNHVSDFFSTVGKPKNEADEIRRERRIQRRHTRLREESHHKHLQAQKQMEQQQKDIMAKIQAGQGKTMVGE